jgi:hypothetical protein
MIVVDRWLTAPATRRLGVIAAAGLIAAGTVGLVPSPAVAGQPSPLLHPLTHIEVTARARATSTTGRQLDVKLDAEGHPTATRGSLSIIDVSVQTPSGVESHDFFDEVATIPVQFASGHGHLSAPNSRLRNYGQLNLAIKATGKTRRTSCAGAPAIELRTTVNLVGRFLLATRSRGPTAWGRVGSSTHRTALAGVLTRTYGFGSTRCHRAPPPACAVLSGWGTSDLETAVDVETDGTADGTSQMTISRIVPLGPHLLRFDDVSTVVPPPRFTGTSAHQRLNVTTTGSSVASGSEVLSASAPAFDEHEPCRLHGATHTETVRRWSATATSHDLVAHEQVYGILRVPDETGSFEHESYA